MTATAPFKIGTRGSPLALVQAEAVATPLRANGVAVEIVPVRTEGDRRLEARLADPVKRWKFNPGDLDAGDPIQDGLKREWEEERGGVHRSERSYGSFYREIPLPEGAKSDQAKAQFNNGVLEVTVPVPESKRQTRQITIESGEPERKPVGQTVKQQTQTSRAG